MDSLKGDDQIPRNYSRKKNSRWNTHLPRTCYRGPLRNGTISNVGVWVPLKSGFRWIFQDCIHTNIAKWIFLTFATPSCLLRMRTCEESTWGRGYSACLAEEKNPWRLRGVEGYGGKILIDCRFFSPHFGLAGDRSYMCALIEIRSLNKNVTFLKNCLNVSLYWQCSAQLMGSLSWATTFSFGK